MAGREPALAVERLREQAEAGSIDTVLLAMADMQGRLQGKRCHVRVEQAAFDAAVTDWELRRGFERL